jgi:hypothetical protein
MDATPLSDQSDMTAVLATRITDAIQTAALIATARLFEHA